MIDDVSLTDLVLVALVALFWLSMLRADFVRVLAVSSAGWAVVWGVYHLMF